MQEQTLLRIDDIVVPSRFREFGNYETANLKKSLATYGLIQPIVVDQNNVLVGGGRRLQSAKELGWVEIPVTYKESISERQRREMEVEENIQRKAFTWQERIMAVAEVHGMRTTDAAIEGDKWTREQTGQLLGIDQSSVHWAIHISRELKSSTDSPLWKASGVAEAIQMLRQRASDRAEEELAKRSLVPTPTSESRGAAAVSAEDIKGIVDILDENDNPPTDEQPRLTVRLSETLIHADCLDYLSSCQSGSFHHVVSDPPYAIDMENLDQENVGMKNIDRVEGTHDVEENLELFRRLVPELARVTKDGGFIVLWCDMMHFRHLHDLGVQSGLAVQRWPLVWVKSHQCMNAAARFNYTKATEVAIVMRKKGATLVKHAKTNYMAVNGLVEKREYDNPFAKPLGLWKDLIYDKIATAGQTVLDPCAGEGSATLAAIDLGLCPVAIEIDQLHYNKLVNNVRRRYETITKGNVIFQ